MYIYIYIYIDNNNPTVVSHMARTFLLPLIFGQTIIPPASKGCAGARHILVSTSHSLDSLLQAKLQREPHSSVTENQGHGQP